MRQVTACMQARPARTHTQLPLGDCVKLVIHVSNKRPEKKVKLFKKIRVKLALKHFLTTKTRKKKQPSYSFATAKDMTAHGCCCHGNVTYFAACR